MTEQMQAEAIKRLKTLKVCSDFISCFKRDKYVTMFEPPFGAGYWTWQYDDITNKINEIEASGDKLVYAVTHEFTEFGEIYDFLIVTNEESEWPYEFSEYNTNAYYAFAYCWNKTDETFSEYGDIVIKPIAPSGGIKRIG